MAEYKYLDLVGLQHYDEKLKAHIDSKDAEILAAAEALGVNYDPAGTAATKVQELADGQVKANKEAIGTLDNLETTAKSDLVTALNEVRDAVSDVANAAATQTALQGEIDRAKGEEARIEGLVTAEAERAAQAEAGLQAQINTIMNNPDTEGVINSINEFTQYIADHGEIAEGFRADIDANAQAIAAHEAYVGKLERSEYRLEKTTLNFVDTNRVTVDMTGANIEFDKEYRVYWDGTGYNCVAKPYGAYYVGLYVNGNSIDDSLAVVAYDRGTPANSMVYKNDYETASHIIKIYSVGTDANTVVEYIDELATYEENRASLAENELSSRIDNLESAISAEGTVADMISEAVAAETVARTEAISAAEGKITTLEGKVGANETTIAELQEADAGIIERVAAVEAQLGDGESSVADLIADAKAEAISTAAGDATTKADKALTDAKAYADEKATAIQNTIDNLGDLAAKDVVSESDLDADLKAKVNASAEANHSHTNKDVLDGITAEKVAAWDAAEQNAKDHADDLDEAMDIRVKAVEDSLKEGGATALAIADAKKAGTDAQAAVEALEAALVEITTAEIDAMFNA